MIRGASKNHNAVTVVTDTKQYAQVIAVRGGRAFLVQFITRTIATLLFAQHGRDRHRAVRSLMPSAAGRRLQSDDLQKCASNTCMCVCGVCVYNMTGAQGQRRRH